VDGVTETPARAEGDGVRHLVIVAPSKPELYERLTHLFFGLERVEVIFDRRRPRTDSPATTIERRRRSTVEAELSAHGCAIVSRGV
jgi:hypothetical protein